LAETIIVVIIWGALFGCLCYTLIFELLNCIFIEIIYNGCKFLFKRAFNKNINHNSVTSITTEDLENADPVIIVNPVGPVGPVKTERVDDPC
jgi:hypothetical protein